MAELTADQAAPKAAATPMLTVVAASSAGTAFEWYDFFVFGSLTAIISKTFFSGLSDTAGLIEDGVPVAGAVAAPATGEVWFTTAAGARKRMFGETEGQPVHVRKPVGGKVLALTSHTLKDEQYAKLQAEYGITDRQPMDSSLKLCIIAEGGADIYPRHGTTMEWDIAAGHAVLAAAGGTLTATDGTPFLYGKADEGFKNGWFVARGG